MCVCVCVEIEHSERVALTLQQNICWRIADRRQICGAITQLERVSSRRSEADAEKEDG